MRFRLRTLLIVGTIPIMVLGLLVIAAFVCVSWPTRDKLIRSTAACDEAAVKFYLWFGVDPNEPPCHSFGCDGRTPLTAAAKSGDARLAQILLDHGANPNSPEHFGWTLQGQGDTPLTIAAQQGDARMVRLLIMNRANVNLPAGGESRWCTPLSVAARNGHLEICQLLLEAGANPNEPLVFTDPVGRTALDEALRAKHGAIADLLIEHGAVEGAPLIQKRREELGLRRL